MTNQIYYETMYILRPDIAEDEVNYMNKYNKLLEELGGKILDSQMRGKRLAYPIAKHREGIYVQLSHQGDGQHISKIEKAMRISEDVIRYLTVKQEGLYQRQDHLIKEINNQKRKKKRLMIHLIKQKLRLMKLMKRSQNCRGFSSEVKESAES